MKTIEKAKYEGYLWYSDKKIPEVFHGDKEIGVELDDNQNPFVIEGNLWDIEKSVSILIKYADGKHIVRRTLVSPKEINGTNDNNLNFYEEKVVATSRKTFIAHRINWVRELNFLQYWRTEKDDFCEGMNVLQPAELVFIGFKKEEEEKK